MDGSAEWCHWCHVTEATTYHDAADPLARTSLDPKYKVGIDRILRAIATPELVAAQRRWVGDFVLALEETKGVRGVAR